MEVEDWDGITIFEDVRLQPLGTEEQKELVGHGQTILCQQVRQHRQQPFVI
ncbi:MAG: hypothetical protein IMHGJWDQ_001406 [Candidatus Fervidibacter sp.]